MKKLLLAFMLTTCAFNSASADETPVIPGIGMMHDIPDAHEMPDRTLDYKIVFDVQTLGDSADDVAPSLRKIGVLINTFHHYGVSADHMHIVAIFHGETIVLVTKDDAYQDRTGAHTNPNDQLLQALKDAGVSLVVCGQSARAQHYTPASLLPFITTNLSATVSFINLGMRGYVRITE